MYKSNKFTIIVNYRSKHRSLVTCAADAVGVEGFLGATRSSSESSSSIEASSDANELLLTFGAETIIAARYTHGKSTVKLLMYEYCTVRVAPTK